MTLPTNPELGSDCQSSGDPSTFLRAFPSLFHMTVLPRTPTCPFMGTKMGTPPPHPHPHWALIPAALYQMGGDLAFHQVIGSPNPLQLGSRGWGLFHGPHSPYLNTVPWWPGSSQIPQDVQRYKSKDTSLHFFIKDAFLILVASFVSSNFLSQANTFFFFFCSHAQWNMCFSFLSYTLCNSTSMILPPQYFSTISLILKLEPLIYGTLGQNRLLNSVQARRPLNSSPWNTALHVVNNHCRGGVGEEGGGPIKSD